ncbi:hypothetical protein CC1G_04592 [Coprinopsis cinerea okayama7|uniref:Uncharacterized protein n=1 Tax=Coprinopsis cinerea (strain Okayama-7 / 130 / ATCC MYA-4618 / FGSC 9003) TaxID=240176 RepID=A8N514_COPC7|nr:hypothetical protein CC1G_04592 [Coprinopsis cinerea okayama7\|eukprot:XP_001829903.1 hypothetical protein CC1G_04592 [Coprinopsis cinerea okayama7\
MSRRYPNYRISSRATGGGRLDGDIHNHYENLTISQGMINGGHMVNGGNVVLAPNHGSITQNTYHGLQGHQAAHASQNPACSTSSTNTSQSSVPLTPPSGPPAEGGSTPAAEGQSAALSSTRRASSSRGRRAVSSRFTVSRNSRR